jgi:hypothetical protein
MKTEKGKAALLVGYKGWGKSWALRELTGGNPHIQIIWINNERLFVRHTSNDDVLPNDKDSFPKFIDSTDEPFPVIAFCPNFDREPEDAPAILNTLKKRYDLSFWVIKDNQNRNARLQGQQIEETIINRLRGYGNVEIFTGKHTPKEIADEFRRFLETLA